MQHILDAIQASQETAGGLGPDEFASLEIPDHDRAATVHQDQVGALHEGLGIRNHELCNQHLDAINRFRGI